jgi:DNA polymerase-3 subunit epsilon
MKLKLERPLAFFDLETTGTTIGKDRIIEISILKVHPDGSRESYTTRINPGVPIPEVITGITGISDADVKDMPGLDQVAGKIIEILNGCDLAGYNSNKFDIPFLVDEMFRVGITFDMTGRRMIDVQNIFHKMEPRTLSAAYKFYCSKELVNAHSADADTEATFEIFEAQLEKYPDVGGKSIDELHKFTNMHNTVDLAGRLVYNEKGEEIINFGKHKGKFVEEVFAAEPSYYEWIKGGDFARETKAVFESLWNRYQQKKINLLKEKFGGN